MYDLIWAVSCIHLVVGGSTEDEDEGVGTLIEVQQSGEKEEKQEEQEEEEELEKEEEKEEK